MAVPTQKLKANDVQRGFSFGEHFAVLPSDTVNHAPHIPECLYIGTTGDVVVVTPLGTAIKYVGVPAGQYIWVRSIRVNSTGTTASNIVGLY